MTVDELIVWMEAKATRVCDFMTYEPAERPGAELADCLDAWFGSRAWRDTGHRFVDLGEDCGGMLAAWLRPSHPGSCPIVFFGSEGEAGVLCASADKWVQLLGHAPTIDEGVRGVIPAHICDERSMCLDEGFDPERADEAHWSLNLYRESLRADFGDLPPLDELTSGLEALNGALARWIAGVFHAARPVG